MRRKFGALGLTASLAVVAAPGLAGCSEGTSPTGANARHSAGTAVDSAAAKAEIDKAKAVPSFTPPGPAFDAAKGKTIVNVSLNSTVPFNQIVDAAMGEAGQAAGVKVVQFTNQGRVSQWMQLMGVQSFVQQLFYGGAVLVAVALSQLARGRVPLDNG